MQELQCFEANLFVDNKHRANEMYKLIDLGKIDFLVDFQSFMLSANKVASKPQNCPI